MNGKGNIALWAWDDTNKVPVRLQADENGFVKVDMSSINLNDLGDVNVPTPSDGDGIYWDNAAGKWQVKAFLPLAGGTMTGDIQMQANKLRWTGALLKELNPGELAVRQPYDDGYAAFSVNDLWWRRYMGAFGDGAVIQACWWDDCYLMFLAMDNGEDLVEVARLQGAADPYFQATLPMVLKPATEPGTLVEGHIWYDSTDDKIKYKDAAGVKTIAREERDTMARAYRSGDQLNLTHQIFNKVQLNAETYDPGGNFDAATNYRYVVPKAGYYLIHATVQFFHLVTDSRYILRLLANGSTPLAEGQSHSSGADYLGVPVSDMRHFSADDYIELYVYPDVAVDTVDILGGDRQTYMTVTLIQAD